MFWMFIAACWGASWCFEHDRPELGIFVGFLFAVFYFIDRWIDRNYIEEEDDDLL